MSIEIVQKSPICPRTALRLAKEKVQLMSRESVTLSRYLNEFERKKAYSSYQFPQLLMALETAFKSIAATLKKCGMAQIVGLGLEKTIKWIEPKRIDRYFNEIIINLAANSHTVCLIACKDSDDVIRIDNQRSGKYILAFSATDSAVSGVDASLCTGTTFAVYRKKGSSKLEDKDVLQAGDKMLCGGYVLYGCSTVLVLAFEGGSVNGFTLDYATGEFILTDENIKTPPVNSFYSLNEGYTYSFEPNLTSFIEKKKSTKTKNPWTTRYTGSLVGDFHRTLKMGGLYLYPATKENPNGKFRLLYECSPLAFVMKQAGGLSTNGKVPILDIVPEKIHEKTPFFTGSKENILDLQFAFGLSGKQLDKQSRKKEMLKI